MAVIDGLKAIKEACAVEVVSDSQYVVKGATEWGMFRKAARGDCKNADLWSELCLVTEYHTVTYTWVRGHNGHPENERCNAIAEKMLFESGAGR